MSLMTGCSRWHSRTRPGRAGHGSWCKAEARATRGMYRAGLRCFSHPSQASFSNAPHICMPANLLYHANCSRTPYSLLLYGREYCPPAFSNPGCWELYIPVLAFCIAQTHISSTIKSYHKPCQHHRIFRRNTSHINSTQQYQSP